MSHFGTPFTEEEVEKGSTPLWEQEVTDERGRRRFHGAFTGGFSAGYFNTVGSKEGWTPAPFSSSRSQRASKQEQNAKDYMDEEDLTEELMQGIKAKQEYQSFGGTQEEVAAKSAANTKKTLSGYLDDLVVPRKDTIGERLLRRMGWKRGQAVGVRRKFKKPQVSITKKVYGVQLPPELLSAHKMEVEEEEEDEEKEEEKKGYYFSKDVVTVEYNHKEDSFGIGYNPYGENYKEKSKTGQNQGLHMNSKQSSLGNKFGLGALEDEDDIEVYDQENLEQYDKILGESTRSKMNSSTAETTIESGFNESTAVGKCTDGSLPLRGFRVTSKPMNKTKWFPPPELPANYKSGLNQQAIPSPAVFTGMITNPTDRGKILGETPLPSSQKDVFSYLAPHDKAKLLNLSNRFAPSTEPEQLDNRTTETIEWENREKNKIFTETAAKFKPMSVAMSQRFTSSAIIDSTGKETEKSKTETYQETAAALNMYGKLTRAVEDWYPNGLLCKRFNLKNPHQGKVPPPKKEPSVLLDIMPPGSIDAPTSMEIQPQNVPEELQGPMLEEEEEEEPDAELEKERPSIDLFKAIFEDETDQPTEVSNETSPDKSPDIAEPVAIAPVTILQPAMPIQPEVYEVAVKLPENDVLTISKSNTTIYKEVSKEEKTEKRKHEKKQKKEKKDKKNKKEKKYKKH